MIKAILFDADGVLCEAVELHFESLNDALAEVGFRVERGEEEARYNGKTTRTKLRMLTEEKGLPEEFHDLVFERKQHYTMKRFATDLARDESKVALVSELKKRGLKVAICSNAIRDSVRVMAESIGVAELMDDMLGNEDSPNPKPAPDIYLEGARRLGVDISECVIVEDSDTGMAAARAAGPCRIVRVSGPAQVNTNLLSSMLDEGLENEYSLMQRVQQDDEASKWTLERKDFIAGPFEAHNAWPDYRPFLFNGIPSGPGTAALDFGCGFGRCMALFRGQFGRIDGTDISSVGLEKARDYLSHEGIDNYQLYLTNGTDLRDVPSSHYDVVYSTICLQHICVHSIRYGLMAEFARVLKPGGWFTAQMGFGKNHPKSVSYHANAWGASGTNGTLDCRVEDPSEIESDLLKLGFTEFQHWLRPTGPADIHEQWIFFRARKQQ